MNRQQLIDALAAAGLDVAIITDDVPDAFLQALVEQLAGGEEEVAEGEMPPEGLPPEGEMPPEAMPVDLPPEGELPPEEEEEPAPFAERRFSERGQRRQPDYSAIVKAEVQRQLALERELVRQQVTIDAFCEELKASGLVVPAEVDNDPVTNQPGPLRIALIMAGQPGARKFGEKEYSAQQAMMAWLRGRKAIVRFGELVPQQPQGPGVSPERRKKLLSHTGAGQKVLARETTK